MIYWLQGAIMDLLYAPSLSLCLLYVNKKTKQNEVIVTAEILLAHG